MSEPKLYLENDELARLRSENERLRREISGLRQELVTDDLTGLFNARCLRERLEECIDEIIGARGVPALLFIDVDHFKETNERHGHSAAGKILRQVGRLLATLIRVEDTGFRYGGDEFVILVAGGEQGARLAGERIRSAVERHRFQVRGLQGFEDVRLTVSIGIRTFRPGDSATKVLEEADRAMFEAKRKSRNAVVAA